MKVRRDELPVFFLASQLPLSTVCPLAQHSDEMEVSSYGDETPGPACDGE